MSPTSALEKENLRTPAATSNAAKTPSVFSSATKSLFRKIGNRKLVRMKSNNGNNSRNSASSSQDTPKFRHGLFYNLDIRISEVPK